MRHAALAATVWVVAGCASFATLQRADVLEKGRVRTGFAPFSVGGASRLASPELPFVATVRYGLGENTELSGRFWLIGLGLGAKYQFLKHRPFSASFAPELLAFTNLDVRGSGFDVVLPLLAGLDLGPHQLIVGARLVERWWQISSGGDAYTRTSFPGAVLGFDFAFGKGLHLLPEANLSYWPGGRQAFWTSTLGFYMDWPG